jgi:hypothetical protein
MLILLDIDGVMVSGASWRAPEILEDGFPSFSQRAITGLKRIIAETGATVVLTSSHKSTYGLSQWKAIFGKRGIDVSIDKLEDNYEQLDRKYEILKWLDGKKEEHFVIIDDDKSLNGLPPDVKKKFVLTSSIVGLNDENASSAIEILKAS